jgi:hypothetical protein
MSSLPFASLNGRPQNHLLAALSDEDFRHLRPTTMLASLIVLRCRDYASVGSGALPTLHRMSRPRHMLLGGTEVTRDKRTNES